METFWIEFAFDLKWNTIRKQKNERVREENCKWMEKKLKADWCC